MATVTKGRTFTSGEVVTPAKLNDIVDNATVTGIVDADVSASAAIALSKLATGALPTAITTATDNYTDSSITSAKIASGAVTASKLASYIPVQTVVSATASTGQTSALIPADDTIPLSTEGTEFMTGSITPTSASNSILINFNAQVTAGGAAVVVAIFRSTTCVGAQIITPAAANYAAAVSMCFTDSPATTSAVTYSVRFGNSQGTTYTSYINRASTGRILGGSQKATLTMTEINA